MSAAATLAAFARTLDPADVPDGVREAAKAHLLDAVGCAVAAAGVGEGTAVREVYAAQGGTPEATGVGCRVPLPAGVAAMVNGAAAHTLDFDDTHEASICHVSVVVGPAAIAVAELTGASGAELLAAYVAGCEIVCRIGMAAPGAFHARGFHPTAVCGVFGATAAAGRLLGLDDERLTAALGLAGSFGSGLFAYLADGTETKPLHAGWAAQAGVQAARLAAAGADGPATVLEGRHGLYASHTDGPVTLDEQLADLGRRWETERIAFKSLPACHFMHGAVEAAAAALAGRAGAAPADIASIVVRVPPPAVPIVLEPLAEKVAPRTAYDARFSLPYGVAARLVHGRLDAGHYTDDAIADPAVRELAARVDHEPWGARPAPSPFAGAATLTLADGTRLEARVDAPLGSPESPMSTAAVLEKFRANAGLALPADGVEELAAGVLALEQIQDVGRVFRPLAEAGSPVSSPV